MLDIRGNPINIPTYTGNTLFYSRWDGKTWSTPVDVQISPTGIIEYPAAVVDKQGILHSVWVQSGVDLHYADLRYSSVRVSDAAFAGAWSKSVILAENILYNYYPLDITIDSTGGMHILYSQLGSNAGVYVINSFDEGNSWSEPILLYRTYDPNGGEEGATPVRLFVDEKDRMHATWTRYDKGGNGKAIYYSQSMNFGKTWTSPIEVAKWITGWYETDWISVGVLGDEIHLVWEGGSFAALNERISFDGGKTWNQSNQILPNLVGENGYANLVVDSDKKMHMLVVKRADGYTLSNGIWVSTWENSRWEDPILLGTTDSRLYRTADTLSEKELRSILSNSFTGNGLRYPQSAIANGNEIFVVVVNEWDGDIWSTHAKLSAPTITNNAYTRPDLLSTSEPKGIDLNMVVILSILPVLALLTIVMLVSRQKK
jgi:hypothetical protein